ncbi:MAG: citramalate synthase [Halanaerobiaceae bacterium]
MGFVSIYDTTLRDGSQGEGISFTLEDKLKIVKKLDKLGIDYIEGGWPGSNPKDEAFFRKVQDLDLKHSQVTAFSSTRRPGIKVEKDKNIQKLANSGVDIVTIFAKSWDFHVTDALETSLEENLDMIRDTVTFLKDQGLTVFFDAEHFFDGYVNNPDYALKTLKVAEEAGADELILCDTNGGVLTERLREIFLEVKEKTETPVGIHAHNDGGLGVANSVAAFEEGVSQIQGTMGGIGERCGNADLCSVLPTIKLKYADEYLPQINLKLLTPTYFFVMETANVIPDNQRPYVGKSAFTHKGGIHVSALQKDPATYEHIEPEEVGNERRVLVSELAGKSNFRYKLEEIGLDLDSFDKEKLAHLSNTIKRMEHKGYQFEGAEASLKLLIYREYYDYEPFFKVHDFKIISHNSTGEETNSEAMVKVDVEGERVHTAAEGDGPVNALDNGLRKALNGFAPEVKDMKLIDYKVRVLNGTDGTAAKVRVLIETADLESSWTTVGVSTNIIQASWQALLDSIEYGLLKKEIEEKEM